MDNTAFEGIGRISNGRPTESSAPRNLTGVWKSPPAAAIHQSGAHNVAFISGLLRRAPWLSPAPRQQAALPGRVQCTTQFRPPCPSPAVRFVRHAPARACTASERRQRIEPRSVGQLSERESNGTRGDKKTLNLGKLGQPVLSGRCNHNGVDKRPARSTA